MYSRFAVAFSVHMFWSKEDISSLVDFKKREFPATMYLRLMKSADTSDF